MGTTRNGETKGAAHEYLIQGGSVISDVLVPTCEDAVKIGRAKIAKERDGGPLTLRPLAPGDPRRFDTPVPAADAHRVETAIAKIVEWASASPDKELAVAPNTNDFTIYGTPGTPTPYCLDGGPDGKAHVLPCREQWSAQGWCSCANYPGYEQAWTGAPPADYLPVRNAVLTMLAKVEGMVSRDDLAECFFAVDPKRPRPITDRFGPSRVESRLGIARPFVDAIATMWRAIGVEAGASITNRQRHLVLSVLGFREPDAPEWVKPGAYAFVPFRGMRGYNSKIVGVTMPSGTGRAVLLEDVDSEPIPMGFFLATYRPSSEATTPCGLPCKDCGCERNDEGHCHGCASKVEHRVLCAFADGATGRTEMVRGLDGHMVNVQVALRHDGERRYAVDINGVSMRHHTLVEAARAFAVGVVRFATGKDAPKYSDRVTVAQGATLATTGPWMPIDSTMFRSLYEEAKAPLLPSCAFITADTPHGLIERSAAAWLAKMEQNDRTPAYFLFVRKSDTQVEKTRIERHEGRFLIFKSEDYRLESAVACGFDREQTAQRFADHVIRLALDLAPRFQPMTTAALTAPHATPEPFAIKSIEDTYRLFGRGSEAVESAAGAMRRGDRFKFYVGGEEVSAKTHYDTWAKEIARTSALSVATAKNLLQRAEEFIAKGDTMAAFRVFAYADGGATVSADLLARIFGVKPPASPYRKPPMGMSNASKPARFAGITFNVSYWSIDLSKGVYKATVETNDRMLAMLRGMQTCVIPRDLYIDGLDRVRARITGFLIGGDTTTVTFTEEKAGDMSPQERADLEVRVRTRAGTTVFRSAKVHSTATTVRVSQVSSGTPWLRDAFENGEAVTVEIPAIGVSARMIVTDWTLKCGSETVQQLDITFRDLAGIETHHRHTYPIGTATHAAKAGEQMAVSLGSGTMLPGGDKNGAKIKMRVGAVLDPSTRDVFEPLIRAAERAKARILSDRAADDPAAMTEVAKARMAEEKAAQRPSDPRVTRQREIDAILVEDASLHPAFAMARKAAVMAACEGNVSASWTNAGWAQRVLALFHEYEAKRGGATRPAADATRFIEGQMASKPIAVYERYRSL